MAKTTMTKARREYATNRAHEIARLMFPDRTESMRNVAREMALSAMDLVWPPEEVQVLKKYGVTITTSTLTVSTTNHEVTFDLGEVLVTIPLAIGRYGAFPATLQLNPATGPGQVVDEYINAQATVKEARKSLLREVKHAASLSSTVESFIEKRPEFASEYDALKAVKAYTRNKKEE